MALLLAAGAAGASGALAWTEDSDTASLAAAASQSAALAWTEANDTFAAVSGVSQSAALAWTEENDATAIAAAAAQSVALAWAESDDVTAISGSVATGSADAALAWSEDSDTLSASGDVADSKIGGDDAFHHQGWNKAAWKKKHQREEAIAQTIEATYLKLVGVEPAPQVVAEIKAEVHKDERFVKLDFTQEMKLVEWLSAQINAIQRKQYLDELDDEEALLLLL